MRVVGTTLTANNALVLGMEFRRLTPYPTTPEPIGNIRTSRIDPVGHEYLTSVSCPTAAFCTAVDGYGYAVKYRG